MSKKGTFKFKNPSEADMEKHSLLPLPEDFEPTQEERLLLEMYETVRNYEKQAIRLKEEAARAKLAALDEEFQQRMNPHSIKRKRNANAAATTGGAPKDSTTDPKQSSPEKMSRKSGEVNDETNYETVLDEERARVSKRSREQSEEEMDPLKAQKQREDDLRNEHLAMKEMDVPTDLPVLKRKKRSQEEEPTSLIASMTANYTPPHEFSERLELTNGETLLPTSRDSTGFWEPPAAGLAVHPNEGAFTATLADFDLEQAQYGNGNNTLAIKFHAPADSKRFSINIAASDNDDFETVLFHFNPRHHERGGNLVINDKQEGTWGQAINIPLSQIPVIFGQLSSTLLIQINGEGYDVFLQDVHCARLEHRQELPRGKTNLVVQFPSTDDYGAPENWRVLKVWWGTCPIKAREDLSGVAGVNWYDSLHPRKLFVSGLTKLYSAADIELRIATLERDFRKYGGDRGVQVIAPPNATYAFVEMESEQQCDLALQEMGEQYRINRARRSRHEALQEERAAAASGTHSTSHSLWD